MVGGGGGSRVITRRVHVEREEGWGWGTGQWRGVCGGVIHL